MTKDVITFNNGGPKGIRHPGLTFLKFYKALFLLPHTGREFATDFGEYNLLKQQVSKHGKSIVLEQSASHTLFLSLTYSILNIFT